MHDERHLPELSPEDAAVLDALAAAGFDPAVAALREDQRPRARALLQLLGLMDDYPMQEGDEESLVHATLARIGRDAPLRATRLRIGEAEPAERRGRLRIPDFMTIAAVILIGASLVIPATRLMHRRALETRCANGLRELAFAFDGYAADNGGDLPLARAGISGFSRLGSNVLNLAPLVEQGYCELGHLHCPGHADQPGPSYSYQWRSPDVPLAWSAGPRTLVLGDRNPLIDALWTGSAATPLSGSFNHDGRGQNVLASDGSAQWLKRTVIGRGDNIWLPEGYESLEDGAAPHRAGDVFLAH